jgi:hypothetical protein
MQRITRKNIYAVLGIAFLILVQFVCFAYLEYGRSFPSNPLPLKELSVARWIGIAFSLYSMACPFFLEKPLKKMDINPAIPKTRVLFFLFTCAILPAAGCAVYGEILLIFGIPFWQYLFFIAAGILGVVAWGAWKIKMLKNEPQ